MDIDDTMMRKGDKVGCSQYFADKIVTQDNSVKSSVCIWTKINSEEVWKCSSGYQVD